MRVMHIRFWQLGRMKRYWLGSMRFPRKKMDDINICTPRLTESDAAKNSIAPNAASVTDDDKVINTKIDSALSEGEQGQKELLTGLLTDDYCHVCDAVLLFESQRLSHYEGKKHTQKIKLFLQTKRAEKMNKESGGLQRVAVMDKDRFCDLCCMVFSSPVVARSHYEGKVHAKHLRKQGLQPTDTSFQKGPEIPTLPGTTQASTSADQISARLGGMEPEDPTVSTNPSTEVDLKDPNKYCALCAASFNNPQMALQHYNGRKHQKNHTRQELLKELGEDALQANSLICQMCSIEFNSVEMYQSHMQGNKHQVKEKKVIDLCKSQQKAYTSFADELADYIQVQKARGITPKGSCVLPQGVEDKGDEEDGMNKEEIHKGQNLRPYASPISNLPLVPHSGSYHPGAGWGPPYPCPPSDHSCRGTSYGWDYSFPHQSLPPGRGYPHSSRQSVGRRRRREQSSSSSSSSSSSYSSSSSDSDDSQYRHRQRRRRKRKERRVREEEEEKEERRRRKRQKRTIEECAGVIRVREEDAEEEWRRKGTTNPSKRGKPEEKKDQEEDSKQEGGRESQAEDMAEKREQTEVHVQAEIIVQQGEREHAKTSKLKHRKEKKKTKKEVDTRTEEEKLWDESILGL
ncbi:zinc finger matrin-type protein 1 [Lampris incognitus]|uniref:zinc finger matrin-type protein 1 n=1 Tax=Lampris incognitus TaxID=2546036 RepID=UPI0024B52474|nr:zinc finger matrin-type protein 1 [Lampris incognitus]